MTQSKTPTTKMTMRRFDTPHEREKMNIDITKFVCTNAARPNLCSPWTKDGYHYATNGRVAIRIPAMDGFEHPDIDGTRPNVESVLTCHATALSWVPVDSFENHMGVDVNCSDCEGFGKALADYKECHGDGEIECCECNQMRDCPECDGAGTNPGDEDCQVCNGAKTVKSYGNFVTPSGVIDGKYLALFAGFEMGIVPKLMEPIPMRCGDVIGAVMPIQTDFGTTDGPFAFLHEAVIAARKAVGIE